jgi:hypothetical protein
MGVSFAETLLVLFLLAIPVLLVLLFYRRSPVRKWLMRRSEARYFRK